MLKVYKVLTTYQRNRLYADRPVAVTPRLDLFGNELLVRLTLLSGNQINVEEQEVIAEFDLFGSELVEK